MIEGIICMNITWKNVTVHEHEHYMTENKL